MPQEIFRQGNFTGGELDPKMLGRRDLKAYFTTVAGAQNLLPTPQGPIGRRPGLAFVGAIRNPLTAISLAGATITAPNGGTTTYAGGGVALSVFTASIAGVTLKIDSVASGALAIGQKLIDSASLLSPSVLITGGAGSSWTLSGAGQVTPHEQMSTVGAGPVSTAAMHATDPYVFLAIDLGAPTKVSCFDVVNVAVIPAAGGGGDTSGGFTPPPYIHQPWGVSLYPGGAFP